MMSIKWTEEESKKLVSLRDKLGATWKNLVSKFPGSTPNRLRKAYYRAIRSGKIKREQPKVLLFDLETAPILGAVWGLFDQNIPLNQIEQDWFILSFSAKWLNDPPDKIIYFDQRNSRDIEDDSKLLGKLWKLLDEADVVITQNGVQFDSKKVNARFIINGFQPPSSYRHIDTLKLAKKYFGFTSNKLEYMTNKLCTKYKKLSHGKFPGFLLWKECLKGNKDAWNEMQKYNSYDVLSLEELYNKLIPWDGNKTINFNVYNDEPINLCKCGSSEFKRNGFNYTNNAKYQRYKCIKCGAESRANVNLLSKEKKKSLRK